MTTRGTSASYAAHLEALRKKHAQLESQIAENQKGRSTTDFYIKQLKKLKLLVKEEIETVSRKTANA